MNEETIYGTEVWLECKKCGVVETITLGDLPRTPKDKFILLASTQCIKCLGSIPIIIK